MQDNYHQKRKGISHPYPLIILSLFIILWIFGVCGTSAANNKNLYTEEIDRIPTISIFSFETPTSTPDPVYTAIPLKPILTQITNSETTNPSSSIEIPLSSSTTNSILFTPASPPAQDATSAEQLYEDSRVSVSLAEMGYASFNLAGPFERFPLILQVPATKHFIKAAEMTIQYDLSQTVNGEPASALIEPAILEIRSGETILERSSLSQTGRGTLSVSISLDQIIQDKMVSLFFSFHAESDCMESTKTEITILNESSAAFDYEIQNIYSTNLQRGLFPFYRNTSSEEEPCCLVIPDKISSEEAALILNFSASFGSQYGAIRTFSIIRQQDLTDSIKQGSNIIFLGVSRSFPELSEVDFPLSIQNGEILSGNSITEDGGLIQMATSPWNENRGILFIGGESIEGEAEAVQAFCDERARYDAADNVVIARKSFSPRDSDTIQDDHGVSYSSGFLPALEFIDFTEIMKQFSFFIPLNFSASGDGVLTIEGTALENTNQTKTVIDVLLNNTRIKQVQIPSDGGETFTEELILPTSVIHPGKNSIQFFSNYASTDFCTYKTTFQPLITISNKSAWKIPLTDRGRNQGAAMQKLSDFPQGMEFSGNMSDILWVFDPNDIENLSTAVDLAIEIGHAANSSFFQMRGIDPSESLSAYTNFDWILLGKSEQLAPVFEQIAALSEESGQSSTMRSFKPEKNSPLEDGKSIGSVELMLNPDNFSRVILILSGTNSEGFQNAWNQFKPESRASIPGAYEMITDGIITEESLLETPVSRPAAPTAEIRETSKEETRRSDNFFLRFIDNATDLFASYGINKIFLYVLIGINLTALLIIIILLFMKSPRE